MTALYLDVGIDDKECREKLYSGDIFINSSLPAAIEFCEFARELVDHAFSPLDPETAQYHLPVERYAEILATLKPQFIHHDRCKELIPRIIQEAGGDPDQTYFDVPRLRSSTSNDYLTTGIAYAFHPHRDTWYSAPFCQINWWMPIYEIGGDNGMAFHPEHFANAVENTSECYDYYRWNAESRGNAAAHIGTDTREQPKAVEQISLQPEIQLVTQPGGLFKFSAAHLHSSIPNKTGKTRFSIDFRTVHRCDVENQLGAVNVDSRCTGTTLRDFMNASDLSLLPEGFVSLYENHPPPSDAILTFGN